LIGMSDTTGRRRGRKRPAVVTLTLNPAIDVSFSVDKLTPGQKLRCHDLRRDAGGGGINVARAIRRLDGDALAVFPAGGPVGEQLTRLLRREHTPVLAIPVGGETREDFTAEDRATGAEYRFVMPGPRLKPAEWAAAVEAALAASPQVLVASGSLPAGAPVSLYARLAEKVRARDVRLALDAAGPALRHGLAAGAWLVKPNLEELAALRGGPLPDLESRLAACRDLVRGGKAQIVALSMGPEGALIVSADEAWRAAAPQITPVSTVGAGDSFMGGLVHALSRDLPLAEALRWAVAAGSAALMAPGTQLCRLSDVQALLPRIRPERLAVSATPPRPAAA
jgi:6-phosphofructokinase 2